MSERYELDCTGLVCPQPVAKTKRMMSTMKSGELINVCGDFVEAGENIKRFVENHDGKVLEFKINGDNYFLKIQKK